MTSNLVYAACPAAGPTTVAAGTFGDMCGNSTTGGPLNKACCVTAGVTTGVYWIHNGGSPLVTRIESSCTQDVMIPGNLAAEWIAFQANKPTCINLVPSFTWIGLVDANWSTAGNWATGIVPGASDTAIFDDNCQANCGAVTLDSNINVAGVLVDTTFVASTFTANAVSIDVGANGWIQRSTAGLTMNGGSATSITITGPLQVTTGTFNVSGGVNSFAAVTIDGGTLAGGANTVSVSGLLTLSSGAYTSTGTNTFSGGVTKSGGSLSGGASLTVDGTVTNSGGNWTLAAGGPSDFNGTSGTTTVSAGVMSVPDVAGSVATFDAALTLSGTGQMTVGGNGAVVTNGLLTVSSTTPNAYSSTGDDTFNAGVSLTAAGGISTGPSLTQNGVVTISAGTWALGQGVHVFNDDGSDTVTMLGGSLLPMGTVTFDSAGTSLIMTAGVFGTATSIGQVTFTSGVYLDPTVGSVDFNNGLTTLNVGGTLTMRENGGSTNTVVFGDGLAATNTFGGITMVREAAAGAHPNPQFIHGATNITTGTFSLTSDTVAIASNRGAIFGNAAGNNGGTGTFTATGAFTFNCGTRADGNRFYAPSNTTELQGSVTVVNNGCNVGATQFDMDTGSTTLRFSGGNQTLTNSNPFATNTMVVSYTGNSQHKAIGTVAQTITASSLTVSDGGFTGASVAFGAPLTISGTGIPLRFNSTGSLSITTTGVVAAASGSLVVDSYAGVLTLNNVGGITMGGTASGAVTLNPNSPGTIVLTGAGTLAASSHLTVNDAGGGLSGPMPITMQGTVTPANLTIAGTGVLGANGTFTINKSATTDIVAVNSTALRIYKTGQAFNITRGTVRVQPASGTCSGSPCSLNMDNLTIGATGALVCGIGSFSANSVTIVNGGSINCAGYGFNWTGAGGSSNWSVPGNWSGAALPGFNDTAVFNPTYCGSGALCNATINTDQAPYGVHLQTGFPGTITHSANLRMGRGGWRQEAGTFTGGAFEFSTDGSFSKTGGTFTPPSGTTTFHATNAQNLTFTSPTGIFTGPVVITGNGGTYTVTGTASVSGLLTLAGSGVTTANTGFIHALGNVHLDNNGIRGTSVLRFNGTGAQTATSNTTTNYFPAVVITNPTGPVTFTSGDTFLFSNSYTHSMPATIATTGSTISFAPTVTPVTLTFRQGTSYENVFISPTLAATVNVAGTANVLGVLVYGPAAACTNTGGAIHHWGTVNNTIKFNSTFGCQGTTNLTVVGTADRTITDASGALIPTFTVLASGGTITYASGSLLRFANNYNYLGTAALTTTGSTVQFITNSQAITAGTGNVYNNVDMNPTNANTITLHDSLNMVGTLNLGSTNNLCTFTKGTGAGTIVQTGNRTNITGTTTARGCAGTGILRLAGGSAGPAQTIFDASSARIPTFEVTANAPNRVVFGSNTTYSFRNTYTWSGTADLVPNTSTAQFAAAAANGVTPGSVRYYRVNFDNAGPFTLTGTAAATDRITFGGTAGGTINGGTLELVGTGTAVTQMIFSHAFNGTANLSFTGTGNQATVSTSAGAAFDNMTGTLRVDKVGRTVTYLNGVTFNNSKPVSLTGGTLRFNGSVNATTTTSTWTGQAGTRFEAHPGNSLNIGNLVLNGGTFDKNTATVTIRNAAVPCTNGVLVNGNPVCGGDVTD